MGTGGRGARVRQQATRSRTDASVLAARLGTAPPAGAAKLDQATVDALVALIDAESERRRVELEREMPAALAKLPWPVRKLVGHAVVR